MIYESLVCILSLSLRSLNKLSGSLISGCRVSFDKGVPDLEQNNSSHLFDETSPHNKDIVQDNLSLLIVGQNQSH